MLPSTKTMLQSHRDLRELQAGNFRAAPAELARFWLATRNGRLAPRREEIDPVAMPRSLLPYLILWNVEDGDYRVRLAGTEVCTAAGRELRGITLTQMHGADNRDVWDDFNTVSEGSAYSYVERSMGWVSGRNHSLYCRLLLPLSIEEGRAAHLIGAYEFPKERDYAPTRVARKAAFR